MNVIEPGHIYELNTLDGDGKPQRLVFVNREDGTEHPGTQIQEVLRMQIDMLDALADRINHCDNCLRWEGNDHILKHVTEAQRRLRLAILLFEQRALERKMDKHGFKPEGVPIQSDGHFAVPTAEPHEHVSREDAADAALIESRRGEPTTAATDAVILNALTSPEAKRNFEMSQIRSQITVEQEQELARMEKELMDTFKWEYLGAGQWRDPQTRETFYSSQAYQVAVERHKKAKEVIEDVKAAKAVVESNWRRAGLDCLG